MKFKLNNLIIRQKIKKRNILVVLLFCLMIPSGFLSQPVFNLQNLVDEEIFVENIFNESVALVKCKKTMEYNATNHNNITAFVWRTTTYNLAYAIGSVAGGTYSDLKGAKRVYYFYVAIYVVVGFIGLSAIRTGFMTVIHILTIALGLADGSEFSARTSLISHWVPTGYITTYLVLLRMTNNASGHFRNNMLRSGLLPYADFHHYTITPIYLVWWFMFYLNVYSTPTMHPFATDEEKNQMSKYVGGTFPDYVPVRKLLMEYRIWSLGFCRIAHNLWSIGYGICCMFLFRVVMSMPSDILKHTYGSVLIAQHASAVVVAVITDFAIRRWNVSVMYLRTLMMAIGLLIPSCIKLYISFAKCYFDYARVLHTIAVFFESGFLCTIDSNTIDITRHFAGTAIAITASCDAFLEIFDQIISPYIFKKYNVAEYRNMMKLMTIIGIIAAFLHYNFTRPVGASWDRDYKKRKQDDGSLQVSVISLSRYDDMIARAIRYLTERLNRLRKPRFKV